jgi:hypothetical protein
VVYSPVWLLGPGVLAARGVVYSPIWLLGGYWLLVVWFTLLFGYWGVTGC